MSKQNTLHCIAALLLVLALCAAILYGFIGSSGFSGTRFSEEAAGHGGLYLEYDRIFASDLASIEVDGTTAIITGPGKYELSGVLEDGQIIVDAGAEDEVTLELDDVSIHCSYSAPIWVKCAGKVKIKLPEDTVNTLSDGEFYTQPAPDADMPNGCISSAADLTIKGKGSLTVTASFRNGISTSDDLEIRNGLLTVTAPKHALRGKDSVELTGGTISLTAGENAIHTLGDISAEGCTVDLTAGALGMKAVTAVTLQESAVIHAKAPALIGCNGTVSGEEQIVVEPNPIS